MIGAAWPVLASRLLTIPENELPAQLVAPAPAGGWALEANAFTDWRPHYHGTEAAVFQAYRRGDQEVVLYLAYYGHQRRGAELVTTGNMLIPQKHPIWADLGASAREEPLDGGPSMLRESQLASTRQRLLVWEWYRIGGRDLVNPYVAKALLARERLLGHGDEATGIIVATPELENRAASQAVLRRFLADMLPAIDSAVAAARPPSAAPGR
jgi:EpsI family protein